MLRSTLVRKVFTWIGLTCSLLGISEIWILRIALILGIVLRSASVRDISIWSGVTRDRLLKTGLIFKLSAWSGLTRGRLLAIGRIWIFRIALILNIVFRSVSFRDRPISSGLTRVCLLKTGPIFILWDLFNTEYRASISFDSRNFSLIKLIRGRLLGIVRIWIFQRALIPDIML